MRWETPEAAATPGGFRPDADLTPLAVREGSLVRYAEDVRITGVSAFSGRDPMCEPGSRENISHRGGNCEEFQYNWKHLDREVMWEPHREGCLS